MTDMNSYEENGMRFECNTLAARGLEERRNFEELLTESVGRVHFSWLIMFVLECYNQICWAFNFFR
jgi:hypothetical protein